MMQINARHRAPRHRSAIDPAESTMKKLTRRNGSLLAAGSLALLLAAAANAQVGMGMMHEEGASTAPDGWEARRSGCPCPMMQPRSRGMHRGVGGESAGMMGYMALGQDPATALDLEGIDLTPEQRAQVRDLRHSHRQRHYERLALAMNLRDDLRMLMQEETPDPNAVQRLHARMAAVHGEMLADGVRLRNTVREMLTPEQRQALSQSGTAASGAVEEDHTAHH
jgi:periplasmic protein CpxP/Spy